MEKSSILKIKKELQNIKFRYEKKYGAVIFNVKIKSLNGAIFLEGMVLSEKQKNEVFLVVKENIKDIKIKNKIKILGDFEENLEIGWGVVISDIADIWAKFPNRKNIIDATRASQALKSDSVRILARKNKWLLIQTRDLAIGWIDSSQIIISKRDTIKKEWEKIKRAKPEEIIKKKPVKNIQNKFLGFLNKYLNAGYLLGGMTEKGIDCSGLTEKFYSDVFGIMLPRHSGDQALCGEKIELKAAHFGDLIFLRHKKSKFAHIGIVAEKIERLKSEDRNFEHILILNSRLEKKGVIIEDLFEILRSYNLISVGRIIKKI